MGLSDDLPPLADRVLARLHQMVEYHVNSMRAWRLIEEAVAGGLSFSLMDMTNGQETSDGGRIVVLSQRYLAEELPSSTLEKSVAVLEEFLIGFYRLWLKSYPVPMAKRQIAFDEIERLPDKEAIVERFVDRVIRELAYKGPADWFKTLKETTKLGNPTDDEIRRSCEIKATRDVLVHNQGIVNWLYLDKTGALARFAEGQQVEIPHDYLVESTVLIRKIIEDMTAAAVAKHSRPEKN